MGSGKTSVLTLNQQEYLEAIHELCKDHGHTHTKLIADKLGYRMASVTVAVQNLAGRGFLNYLARKSISLTPKGRRSAEEMERKHAALADFFSGILGIDKDKAQETACKLEHTVDSGLSGKLAEFAEFVRENASGKTAGLIADFREFSAARAQTGIRE